MPSSGEMKVSERDGPSFPDDTKPSLWSRWRRNFSGPASDLPDRRRVADWIRLATGVVLMALLVWHQDHESQTEKEIYLAIRELPHGVDSDSVVHLLYGLGALWALALIVGAAVLSERRRLARDLLIAGVATWAIARLMVELVNGTSVGRSFNVIVSTQVYAFEFPATRVAIVTAVIAVGRPYLARPTRRLGQLL